MFPGISRKSDGNKSYWKGHILPEVFQRERKQARKGKRISHCEMMVSHLIKGWQKGGYIPSLFLYIKTKIEENFSVIERDHTLNEILQNTLMKGKF